MGRLIMDFGNTPATKLTERIMSEIKSHLIEGTAHYNAVYSTLHRIFLAEQLVTKADQLVASANQLTQRTKKQEAK